MPLFLALVLGLLGLAFILAPLFRAHSASVATTGSLTDAIAHAEEAKQALRDIEFDYHLGNLQESDYTELRATYERRALAALKIRYDREQEVDALLDRELARVRARIADEAREAAATETTVRDADAAPNAQTTHAPASSTTSSTPGAARARAKHAPAPQQSPSGPRARRQKGA